MVWWKGMEQVCAKVDDCLARLAIGVCRESPQR